MSVQDRVAAMESALRRGAGALREAGIPFALAGSAACWVRGGPPPEKDIDLVIRPADVDAALGAMTAAGMRVERPPEPWLVKAYDDDILIDLIFEPTGLAVDDALFARTPEIAVAAFPMRVLTLEDVFCTTL